MKDKKLFSGSRTFHWLKPDVILNTVIGLVITTELFAVGVLLYLGTFTRYIADDYCEVAIIGNKPVLSTVLDIYIGGTFRGTYRYSKFLLIGIAELFGSHDVQFLPIVLMSIWLIGMIWSVRQLRKLMGIHLPRIFDFLMAISIVFFSTWQAPNRFQTFFWRSSMAAHFAPLVFIPLISGFILSRINSSRKISFGASLITLIASFLVGGFSEPPTTTLIVVIILLILVAWRWKNDLKRNSSLNLLSCSLAGVLLAFFAMFLSPGNVSYGKTSLAELFVTFEQTVRYTFDFMYDTVRTLPVPSLFSILTSFFPFFIFFINLDDQSFVLSRKRQIWLGVGLVVLAQFILIAASFAPSAYGQAYPAERARFLGRLVMTISFLVEGALLGMLFAGFRAFASRREMFFLLSVSVLFVLAFYPFRAGISMLAEAPDYRQWTSAWDLRETEIQKAIANGEKDLVVRWLPTKADVKEIDGNPNHWVNKCVADYYGVNTVRSVPMGGQ